MKKYAQAHTTRNGSTFLPFYSMYSQRLKRGGKKGHTHIFKSLFPLIQALFLFLPRRLQRQPR